MKTTTQFFITILFSFISLPMMTQTLTENSSSSKSLTISSATILNGGCSGQIVLPAGLVTMSYSINTDASVQIYTTNASNTNLYLINGFGPIYNTETVYLAGGTINYFVGGVTDPSGIYSDPAITIDFSVDTTISPENVTNGGAFITGNSGVGGDFTVNGNNNVNGNINVNGASYINGICEAGTLVATSGLINSGVSYLMGNVGIGTVNLTQGVALDVKGNVNLNNQLSTTAGCLNSGYYLYKSGTVAYGMKLQSTAGKFGTMIFGPNQSNRFIGFGKAGTGLTDSQIIEYMRVDLNNGNVGIGTTTPREALEVFGLNKTPKIALRFTGTTQAAKSYIQSDTDGHYLELGTFGTAVTGQVFGQNLAGSTTLIMSPKVTGYGFIGTSTAASLIIGTNNIERMRITPEGFIGIGTTTPDALLSVKGTIHAMEVVVDLCPELADFVFHPSYNLMPLHEVEQYVKTNSHLPEIPSAAEVSKNGLSLGEMQNKLLQKIEELTLYVIEQQKEINLLKQGQK